MASAQTQMPDPTLNWGAYAINAITAWPESTGSGVKIAILDSGIGPINYVKVKEGYNCVNGNTDTTDRWGHGTMVASILAASHSNSLGIWGIAPDVEIYPVKVMDDTGAVNVDWAIAGVRWAIEKPVQIISISWYVSDNRFGELERILNEAYYDHGILIVAAAGNNGAYGVECPARYDSTIAVAAVTQNLQKLLMSAIGPAVELAAPGENITGILPGNVLGSGTGTSFAVPYVTGTAALIWEKNSSLTNKQVRDILCTTATNKNTPDRDTLYGYGVINATAAIQVATGNLINKPNPTNNPTPNPTNNNNNNNNPNPTNNNPTNSPNPNGNVTDHPSSPPSNTNSYITSAIISIVVISVVTIIIFSVTYYVKKYKFVNKNTTPTTTSSYVKK
jgi:subtilisin family serine protease